MKGQWGRCAPTPPRRPAGRATKRSAERGRASCHGRGRGVRREGLRGLPAARCRAACRLRNAQAVAPKTTVTRIEAPFAQYERTKKRGGRARGSSGESAGGAGGAASAAVRGLSSGSVGRAAKSGGEVGVREGGYTLRWRQSGPAWRRRPRGGAAEVAESSCPQSGSSRPVQRAGLRPSRTPSRGSAYE